MFPAQSSNQSTNQLDVTSGKFDWSYNYLPNVQADLRREGPEHNHYWFPPGGTIGLFLNLTKAPYNDVNFRTGSRWRWTVRRSRRRRSTATWTGQPVRADPAQPEEVARPERCPTRATSTRTAPRPRRPSPRPATRCRAAS